MNVAQKLSVANLSETDQVHETLMVVSMDSSRILIPGKDIKSFESTYDISTDGHLPNSIGWIKYEGQKIPVYCITSEMELSSRLLDNRSICILFNSVNMALMCSDIRVLKETVHNIQPLPQCMSSSATPVNGFCLYYHGSEIRTTMVFSARSIKKYIQLSIM